MRTHIFDRNLHKMKKTIKSVDRPFDRLCNKCSKNRIPFRLYSPYHSDWLALVYILHWYSACVVSFLPRKRSRKKKQVQTECLQSVHLYSLSRNKWIALRREAALGLPHDTAVFQGKIVFIFLTYIHISFLCWKQIEGKPDLWSSQFFFYSYRSIGLSFANQLGRINRQCKRFFFCHLRINNPCS